MKLKSVFSILSLIVTFWASAAHANYYAGVEGGINFGSANISPLSSGYTTGGATGYALGLFGGMSLSDLLGLELGASYLVRGESVTVGTLGTLTVTSPYIYIPLSLTVNPIPYFSFLVGPYLAIQAGNVGGSSTINGVNAPSGSASSNGFTSTDIGLDAAVRGLLPVAPTLSILIEARYNLGLSNVSSNSTQTINLRDFMLQAGVKVGF